MLPSFFVPRASRLDTCVGATTALHPTTHADDKYECRSNVGTERRYSREQSDVISHAHTLRGWN
jgi:hypothetical protein